MIDSGTSIDSTPEILRLRFATVKRNSAYFVLPRVAEGIERTDSAVSGQEREELTTVDINAEANTMNLVVIALLE